MDMIKKTVKFCCFCPLPQILRMSLPCGSKISMPSEIDQDYFNKSTKIWLDFNIDHLLKFPLLNDKGSQTARYKSQ